MPLLSIDKTKVWFCIDPNGGKVHAVYGTHTLCTSQYAKDWESLVTTTERHVCSKCLELLNTAVHDARGAHYGGH